MRRIILSLLILALASPAYGGTIYKRLEQPTTKYGSLPFPQGTQFANNETVKAILFSTGLSQANVPVNVASVAGGALLTNVTGLDMRIASREVWGSTTPKVTLVNGAYTAVFYGGAAGTGETLGVDVLAGFDFTSGFSTDAGVTINSANTYTSAGTGGPYKANFFSSTGQLYKGTLTLTAANSVIQTSSGGSMVYLTKNSTKYFTIAEDRTLRLRNPSAGTTIVSAWVNQRVNQPDGFGIWCGSTAGATDKTLTSISASFNIPNPSSVTVQITRN